MPKGQSFQLMPNFPLCLITIQTIRKAQLSHMPHVIHTPKMNVNDCLIYIVIDIYKYAKVFED